MGPTEVGMGQSAMRHARLAGATCSLPRAGVKMQRNQSPGQCTGRYFQAAVRSGVPTCSTRPHRRAALARSGHGVRVRVAPLTTALMVAARSDGAVEAMPETASDEERALVFAKAIARRAVSEWEGVGDADGNPVPVTAAASTRSSRSGRSSRPSRRSTFRRACCWMRKKTPPRPRRLALRRGRPLLRGLRASVPGLPGAAEPPGDP